MHLPAHPLLHKAVRIIGILLLGSLILSSVDVYKKQSIITQYQDAYRKAKAENDRLKRLLADAQTPEYVERAARDKLGLVKEGESLVLMDTSKVEGAGTGEPPTGQNDSGGPIPTWKKWWKLFY